ncbi:c-type cytochrome [Caldimonas tepidiphila]|uniref:c-type cytochrome n=1 Tax=Caldimonas tepidiphila TaxID=2315841 RepID=UPI000E5A2AA8|nr:cytochrome c family protein [Caldimonas tepidiphila]
MRSALVLALALAPALGAPVHAAPGDAAAGKALFASRCASCHKVGPSARSGFGPHLNGIVGRRAASTGDYAYSPALGKSGLVWSEENLAAFLRDPGAVVPGTRMRFHGIRDEKRMADLLAYLRTLR